MVGTNLNPKYTYTKRGVYYFSKAIPSDMQLLYDKPRLTKCLRTKSKDQARIAANSLAAQLDQYWSGLRLQTQTKEFEAQLLLKLNPRASGFPTIEEALAQYLAVKGKDKGELFFTHTKRSIGYLSRYCGSRQLDKYSSSDAAKLRDALIKQGLRSSSIQRNFSGVKAVVNFAILENGLDCKNPFSGVYIAAEKNIKRIPFTSDELRGIQKTCKTINDDIRWLVALISDTGMRLSEAVGLLRTDIDLHHATPHVIVQVHTHRSLKNQGSVRKIPLVGSALWASHRLVSTSSSEFCFPRYIEGGVCKSNSASAAINKWIKVTTSNQSLVIHSFRHSFRDRLRAIEAPTEMIDRLGGWTNGAIGQRYGDGYQLEQLHSWMEKLIR